MRKGTQKTRRTSARNTSAAHHWHLVLQQQQQQQQQQHATKLQKHLSKSFLGGCRYLTAQQSFTNSMIRYLLQLTELSSTYCLHPEGNAFSLFHQLITVSSERSYWIAHH
jgi:hypothetical protein